MIPSASAWDDRLRQHFGLTMLDHPARLRDGVRAACAELALEDEGALLSALDRNDPKAKAALARALTVGETYFFREPIHLEHFRDKLLPDAIARGRFPVIIVSAGCSSGEEAYTLAIIARETLGDAATQQVRVLGFDLNPVAVASARRGVYRPWSFRGMSEHVKRRWFDAMADGASVKAEVRAIVSFEQRNLVDPREALAPESADVIFCRNVLIYFDDASAKAALGLLDRALRPGGSLLLGSAEAAFYALADLGAHEVGEAWIHGREEKPHSTAPPPPVAPLAPAPRLRRLRLKPASNRKPRPIADPAPSSKTPNDVDAILTDGWRSLATNPTAAADAARRAILLDRTLAAAHVLAASAALALQDSSGARASLRHARRALAEAPTASVVRGADGATVAELSAYCARIEKALARP